MDPNIREYQKYLMMQGGGQRPAASQADYSKFFPSKGKPLLKTGLSIAGGTLGAILGTLATPGAGTAVGGAIGSGLGTALGRALGGQAIGAEGGAGEIGLDALLGGAFSGFGKAAKAAKLGGTALGVGGKELAAQTAKGLGEGAGVAIGRKGITPAIERISRGAVIAPGTQSVFKTAPQQAAAADWVRRYGLTGAGATKFENITPVLNQLTKQADDVLRPITKTIPTSTLKKTVTDISNKLPKGEKLIFDDAIADVLKGTANKSSLTALEVNQILRNVNKSFSGIFGKAARGQQLSQAQFGADKVRKSLKGIIDDLGGEAIKPINKDLSIGLQIQEELFKTKAAKNFRVPIIGLEVPGSATAKQKVADVINRRAAQAAGAQVAAKPLTLRSALTRQAVGQGLGEVLTGQPQQPVETGMEAGLGTDMTDMGAGTMEDTGQQAQIDSYFQGLAIQDLQQTGGKRLAAIKAAYDLFGGGKAEKKSISQQNAERKLNQANKVLGTLESQLTAAGGPQGLAGALPAGLASLPVVGGTLQPRVRAFQDLRQGAVAQLSKALGESGVLTDQDIQRALNLVPTVTDSPEQAAIKFRALRNFLSTADTSSVGTDTRFNF